VVDDTAMAARGRETLRTTLARRYARGIRERAKDRFEAAHSVVISGPRRSERIKEHPENAERPTEISAVECFWEAQYSIAIVGYEKAQSPSIVSSRFEEVHAYDR